MAWLPPASPVPSLFFTTMSSWCKMCGETPDKHEIYTIPHSHFSLHYLFVCSKKSACVIVTVVLCAFGQGKQRKKKLLMVKPQRGVNTTYLPTLFLLRSQCLHAEYKYYIYKYILYTPRVHTRIKYISYVMHQLMSVVFFFLSFFSSSSCRASLLLLLFAPINVALESIPQHRCLEKKKN